MISNKTTKNISLVLVVLNTLLAVERAIGVADGSAEWWQLASAVALTAVSVKMFICHRREVRKGNIFGRTRLFE